MKDPRSASLVLDIVFSGFTADIDFAVRCAIQPCDRPDLLLGLGQRVQLFVAQRQRSAADRLLTKSGIANRQQRRRSLIPALLRSPLLHVAQCRQRRCISNSRFLDQQSVGTGHQRLKRQVPQRGIRCNNQIRFAAKLRLGRFKERLIQLAGGPSKTEVTPRKLTSEYFGLLRKLIALNREGIDPNLGFLGATRPGDDKKEGLVIGDYVLEKRSRRVRQQVRKFFAVDDRSLASVYLQLRMHHVEVGLKRFLIESRLCNARFPLIHARPVRLLATKLVCELRVERNESQPLLLFGLALAWRQRFSEAGAALKRVD